MPKMAPCAPRASAATRPRPSARPPAAMTGMLTASTVCGMSAMPPTSPVWPPASVPWAATMSAPASSDFWAWRTRPHITITVMSRSCISAMNSAGTARPATKMRTSSSKSTSICGPDAVGQRGEEVDGERLVGEVAGLLDLLTELLGAERGGAHNAEPAGVGDGGDEAGERDAAHAGEEDGILDAEAVADGGVEGVVHGYGSLREFVWQIWWFR